MMNDKYSGQTVVKGSLSGVVYPLCFLLVCWAVLTGAATGVILTLNNTLVQNGNWISTKAGFEDFVMGSGPFMKETQALARGHLNLGAWHGYQELLYRTPMVLEEMAFDFRLEAEAHLVFFLDKNEQNFTGIRLSADRRFENAVLRGQADGAFTKKQPLKLPLLQPGRWHRVEVKLSEGKATLTVDGTAVESFAATLPVGCRVGFRGSLKPVWVDNVVLRPAEGGEEVRETFFDVSNGWRIARIALLALLAGNVCCLVAFRAAGVSWGQIRFGLLYLHGTAVVIAVTILPYVYFVHAGRYPIGVNLEQSEGFYIANRAMIHMSELLAKFGGEKAPNTRRILFVGGSQTFGIGAARRDEAFVRVLQRELDARPPEGVRVECINAGIEGYSSGDVANVFEQVWVTLHPDLVVANLSGNDAYSPELAAGFAGNLERLLASARQRNIPVIFALEAMDPAAFPEEVVTHRTMREVAAREHVPLIDVHAWLHERLDTGFLWWDQAHPTSYGHGLIAECLLGPFRTWLGQRAAR